MNSNLPDPPDHDISKFSTMPYVPVRKIYLSINFGFALPAPRINTGALTVPLTLHVAEPPPVYGPPRTSTKLPATKLVGTEQRGAVGAPRPPLLESAQETELFT